MSSPRKKAGGGSPRRSARSPQPQTAILHERKRLSMCKGCHDIMTQREQALNKCIEELEAQLTRMMEDAQRQEDFQSQFFEKVKEVQGLEKQNEELRRQNEIATTALYRTSHDSSDRQVAIKTRKETELKMRDEAKVERQKMQQQHAAETKKLEAKIEQIVADHDDKVQQLEDEHVERQKEAVDQAWDSHAATQRERDEIKRDAEARSREFEEFKLVQEQDARSREEQHREALAEAAQETQKLQAQLQEARQAEREARVAAAEAVAQARTIQLQEAHAMGVETLRLQQQEHVKGHEHLVERQKMQQQHAAETKKLQAEIEQIVADHAEPEQETHKLREHVEELQAQLQEAKEAEGEARRAAEQLEATHKAVSADLDTAIQVVNQSTSPRSPKTGVNHAAETKKLEAKIEQIVADHDDKVQRLEGEHMERQKEAVDQVRESHAATKRERDEIKRDAEARSRELEEFKLAHSREEQHEEALAMAEQETQKLQAQLRDARQARKEAVAQALQEAHAKEHEHLVERQKMQQQHAAETEKLEAKIEQIVADHDDKVQQLEDKHVERQKEAVDQVRESHAATKRERDEIKRDAEARSRVLKLVQEQDVRSREEQHREALAEAAQETQKLQAQLEQLEATHKAVSADLDTAIQVVNQGASPRTPRTPRTPSPSWARSSPDEAVPPQDAMLTPPSRSADVGNRA
eukprot:COSAG06_NODE_5518_length_3428_cov_5.337964_1_plen_695_part_10